MTDLMCNISVNISKFSLNDVTAFYINGYLVVEGRCDGPDKQEL